MVWGTGRRKTAVARVRLVPGDGKVTVNDRPLDNYFTEIKDRGAAVAPLRVVNFGGQYDIICTVEGGGPTGQAGAIQMGLGRALITIDPNLKPQLAAAGCLTRDSRMKERKKYGQRGARRRFQFSKR